MSLPPDAEPISLVGCPPTELPSPTLREAALLPALDADVQPAKTSMDATLVACDIDITPDPRLNE